MKNLVFIHLVHPHENPMRYRLAQFWGNEAQRGQEISIRSQNNQEQNQDSNPGGPVPKTVTLTSTREQFMWVRSTANTNVGPTVVDKHLHYPLQSVVAPQMEGNIVKSVPPIFWVPANRKDRITLSVANMEQLKCPPVTSSFLLSCADLAEMLRF